VVSEDESSREGERIMVEAWRPTDLECGAVIYGDGAVNNLDFHREGRFLLMTTKDSAVHLIDAHEGTEKKKLHTRRDQIGLAKYTHHEACVLLTSESEKGNRSNDIHYLCMHDNRYLRYFKGHTDTVTSLAMSPIEDSFITASADKTAMIWNINCQHPVAKLQLPSNVQNPHVQYFGTGEVFGIQVQDQKTGLHSIKLFDARNTEKPFGDAVPDYPLLEAAVHKGLVAAGHEAPTKAAVKAALDTTWDSFRFSPNGKHILVNTCQDLVLILDDGAEDNTEPVAICGRKNDTGMALGACYSADAKYVLLGEEEGEVQAYEIEWDDSKKGAKLAHTLTGHVDPVGCVAANPVYDVIASGCVNTALWVRSKQDSMDTE
jgi:COMPASS component SWD2